MNHSKIFCLVLMLTGILGILQTAKAGEVYHINRTFTPVEFNLQGVPPVDLLNQESEKLTDTVRGDPIVIDSNGTYAIEQQMAIALGYDTAEAAWNAAIIYQGTPSNYPGKIFDNVGWVRGTKSVQGEWGAYLWVLQNRIAFQSSTSVWWRASTNGVPVMITNVIVGSLGNYAPMSNVVDIGPHLDAATNNFPGANQSESREFYVDITNVFYQLSIPDIFITPKYAVTNVGGNNVQYTVTGTNIPNGVTWSINPDGLTSGAVIQASNDWHFAGVMPGNVATNYKIRATSVDNTNFYDEANLAVVGMQSLQYKIGTNSLTDMPDPLYVCKDTTVNFKAIKVPASAPWPGGKPVWGGVVSGSGVESNSYTFSTISTSATDYKIVSAECGNTVSGRVIVCKAELVELTFSGTKYHTVKSDDGTTDYSGPHWLDPNHDGNAGDGHNYPICFTRNDKMVVSGKWNIEPSSPGVSFIIKGDGPGNLDFTNTSLSVSGTNGTISNVECMNAFTNEVDFFDPMTMIWKCSVDSGQNWVNAGTSTNRCYVTLGDPLTDIYYTLVHLGCKNADGQSTTNATADAIYNEFTDRDVSRVSDSKQMTYWCNDQMGGRETAEILQRSDANGNCESWSALFRDFLKVQGITADRIMAMPVSSTDGSILVKNWQFNDPPSGTGTYSYVIGTDAIDLNGVPGQGNPNPPGGFNGHWITLFDNQYYDPSYGSAKVTGTDKDKAYEDGALAGYGNIGVTAARKNDTSTNTTSELNYQVDN